MTDNWLPRALEISRARGFLSPQAVSNHIEHARGFIEAWSEISVTPPNTVLDLGSGGGVPGFVLLDEWPSLITFLDSMLKRTHFIAEVLDWPEVPRRGAVVTGRAESLARQENLAGQFDLVVARSFGPPAVVAECAVRFLRPYGYLIVSEPPEDSSDMSRWSNDGLSQLGLANDGEFRSQYGFRLIKKIARTPEQFPRTVGVPKKKPLF